jgi:hypothetical protein
VRLKWNGVNEEILKIVNGLMKINRGRNSSAALRPQTPQGPYLLTLGKDLRKQNLLLHLL